jgi:structural maintenance of chromosome 2
MAALAKFVVAAEFVGTEKARAEALAAADAAVSGSKAALQHAAELQALIKAKEAEVKALEERRSGAMDSAFKQLVEADESTQKEYVQARTALANKQKALQVEQKTREEKARALADVEKALATLAAKLTQQRADAKAAAANATAATQEVSQLMTRYNAASAGILESAAGEGAGTVADQILGVKTKLSELTAEISSSDMRSKQLRDTLRGLEKSAKAAAADHAALESALARARTALQGKQAQLASLNFDPRAEEQLRSRFDAIQVEVRAKGQRAESDMASLSHLVDFAYDASAMGPGWNPNKVKGTVASLVALTRPETATALEIGAGGRLFQVVVDTEQTGKMLLERGRLRRRVTLIPLNQIKRGGLSERQISLAHTVSRGLATPALSLVTFPEEVRPAMEFAFGNFFVCKDAATANAVTFHPDIRAACVTLDGDMFDPAGTLEGGSAGAGAAGGAAQAMLNRLAAAQQGMRWLEGARAELTSLEGQLGQLSKASTAYAALTSDVELCQHEARLMQDRVGASQMSALEAKRKEAAADLEREEQSAVEARQQQRTAQQRLKDLEAEAANSAKAREKRMAELEKQLDAAKKAAAAVEDKAKKASRATDEAEVALQATETEKASAAEELKVAEESMGGTAGETAALEARVAEVRSKYEAAKAQLDAARAELASADKALKALVQARDKAVADSETAARDAKKLEADAAKKKAEGESAARQVTDLLAKYPWIAEERQFFGTPHGDYDFEAQDPRVAKKELASLEATQAKLERGINKKVIGMMQNVETEYADLLEKRRIIENDKKKINQVIVELDEKKNRALETTWNKVNKDFGSIFSTLLPGVKAKLVPTEGSTVLEGLEVKVAFNGVWKESLTELSGGQRSLLALSLILSLLLFKPAPMYILDEVDAALDLSHTQNIGHMIRTHFSKSQFIVVSLKQGMFGNANVVFRTKFVEGIGSTVTRTVPAGSALLTDRAASENKGPGAKSKGGRAAAAAAEDDEMAGAK